ncbi:hypothetical protein [Microbacterium resistens]|uniref:hypothetical protein n=1 Tax=Microbacterium resistens TaxID=156977 RepID=UPI00082E282F|nr:hypothetical protein [Microbacterium resistens]
MVNAADRFIARRGLETDDGSLAVEFWFVDDDFEASAAYRLVRADGTVLQEMTFHGVDDVQALLFALAGAGDYLHRFVPSASWIDGDGPRLMRTVPKESRTGSAIWQAATD